MLRIVTILFLGAFVFGCAILPASYVPTTGKVGSQTGEACVFKLFDIIPFGDQMMLLSQAADNAGNPTKDVAVINSATWMLIGFNHCVTVKGSK